MRIAEKPITVMDVARVAGVSHTTVSAALRGSQRISRERTEQIRRIASKLDYQPRVAARLLRARRTGQLGLVMPSAKVLTVAQSSFFAPILAHFVSACEIEGLGYHVEFVETDRFTSPSLLPRQLVGGLTDGVVVAGDVEAGVREALAGQQRYPWVSLEEPGEYAVISAYDRALYDVVKHVAAVGHRRIAYAGGCLEYENPRQMLQGFKRGVTDFQLQVTDDSWVAPKPGTSPDAALLEAVEWARRILGTSPRPTVIVCQGAPVARAAIYVAMSMGLRVPQDLSVIAGSSEGDALKGYPRLSGFEADYGATVAQAIDILRRRVLGKPIEPGTRTVPCQVVMRDTFAAPPDPCLLNS